MRVEAPPQPEIHGLGRRDVGDGEEVVVRQFPGQARALSAQVQDFAAHELQRGRHPLHEASAPGAGAEHEC